MTFSQDVQIKFKLLIFGLYSSRLDYDFLLGFLDYLKYEKHQFPATYSHCNLFPFFVDIYAVAVLRSCIVVYTFSLLYCIYYSIHLFGIHLSFNWKGLDKVPHKSHKSHTKNERSRLGQALFYCVQVINLIARGFLVTEGAALKFSHQPFSGLGGDSPRKGEGRGQ